MKKSILLILFLLNHWFIFAQCEINEDWLKKPIDSFVNQMSSLQLDCFFRDMNNPYWKHYTTLNGNPCYDITDKYQNHYMLKNSKKVDSISWMVTNYIIDSKEKDIVNRELNQASPCGQIFPIKQDTAQSDIFLYLGNYLERNKLGPSIFIFKSHHGKLANVPIKRIESNVASIEFTLNVDSVYENLNLPYKEIYLRHSAYVDNYEKTGLYSYGISRLKWNGKNFEHRLLFQEYNENRTNMPIEVVLDLKRRNEIYYKLKRGNIFTFRKKKYFICTNEFNDLFVYRCNSEDYDCEFITKLDASKFHFNDKIEVSSKWFSTFVQIGEGENVVKVKMK
jgi:hypothetical protein